MGFARKFRRSKKVNNVGDGYFGTSTDRDYDTISRADADAEHIMFIGEKRSLLVNYNNEYKNDGYALVKKWVQNYRGDMSHLVQEISVIIGDFLDDNTLQTPENMYPSLLYAYASCCMVPNAYPVATNSDIVSVAFVRSIDKNNGSGYKSRWGVKLPKEPAFAKVSPTLTLVETAIQSCSMAFDIFDKNNKNLSKSPLYNAMVSNGKKISDFFNDKYVIGICKKKD